MSLVNELMAFGMPWELASLVATLENTANVTDFGAQGDGISDDSVAFQAAIDSLSQTNGSHGGTVFVPSGVYLIKSSLLITSQANIRILGPSPCADQVANNAVASSAYQYGAATIVYTGASGTACFHVQAAGPVSGWSTIGITFENFAVVNLAGTAHGFLLSGGNNDGAAFQYDIYFKGVAIGGGDKGIRLTGTDTFNVFIDGLEIGYYKGTQPNWGIYSELTNGPGIACCWKNLRIVHTNIGHIYLGGIAFQIKLDSCTLEACGLSSIVAPLSVGQLSLENCHWEQVGLSAYWNGSSYQNSLGDATPVAPILLGSLAAGNTTSSISLKDCSINTKVIGGGGATQVLPLMVSYDSSVIELQGGHAGPIGTGLNQGQPYFVRNAHEAQITLRDVQCEPMNGAVLPIGGNQTIGGLRLIRIDNCKGLLAYPIVQPTNGSADYNANDFAGVQSSIVRTQAVQPTGAAISLLTVRKELTIPDSSWLTTGNIALFGPFNKGDTLWVTNPASLGMVACYVCLANNVITYSASQWLGTLLTPKAILSILPAYSASMTFDLTGGSYFFIQVTDGNAFTINAPTNGGIGGQEIEVTIQNISGGALGAATWNAVFRMNAWVQPANTFNCSIRFRNFASNWIEVSRATAVNN